MTHAALLAIIFHAEATYGVPHGLLAAICQVESNLNPQAVVVQDGNGGRTSIGLCMVQHRTARQFRPGISTKELYSPATNANVAAAYLRRQYDRYGSWTGAVIAYNKGNWAGGRSNRYSRKVMNEYARRYYGVRGIENPRPRCRIRDPGATCSPTVYDLGRLEIRAYFDQKERLGMH